MDDMAYILCRGGAVCTRFLYRVCAIRAGRTPRAASSPVGTQESGDGDPRSSSRAKTSGRAARARADTRRRGDVGCSRILEPGREIDRDT